MFLLDARISNVVLEWIYFISRSLQKKLLSLLIAFFYRPLQDNSLIWADLFHDLKSDLLRALHTQKQQDNRLS